MQDYTFKHKYNGIFLRWTIGFLHRDKEVIDFLKKAKEALIQDERKSSGVNKASSYIYVVDNVLDDKETEHPHKGEM